MFTEGRIAFVLFFITAFVIGLVWTYKRDKSERKENYKGSTRIVITILVLLIFLSALTKTLRWF